MTCAVELSVVTTLYQSAGTIEEFVLRAEAAAREQVAESFEIVVVNDGSPDDSLEKVRGLQDQIPELVIVDLSRNFGHHVALLEGLRQSSGKLVFLLDSDLEEPPEWLSEFDASLKSEQADVVYGYQSRRRGRFFERASGALYWFAFRRLSGLDLPPSVITCRLMTREYVDAIGLYGEREVNMGGIFSVAGFKQIGLPVAKGHKGVSSYSFRMKLWHMVNSISAFSTKPLNAIFLMGVGVSFIGFLLLLYLLVLAVFQSESPAGWISVMASVWLIGGLVLVSLGVMAIYLGKVLAEVKGRPRVVVRAVERASAADAD